MPEQQLFEYAVIRVVPRVEREEFLNVGVVLYCAKLKFLKVICKPQSAKLLALCPEADELMINEYLVAFEQVCMGDHGAGTISRLPIAERFRWLTATRSTVVQTSKVHPGLCTDPMETLERLYRQMVC